MRGCVLHGQKDLRLETLDEPSLKPGEVRVRIAAGGICGSDLHYFFEGRVGDFNVREPMVLGHEISGDVVEVGPDVTRTRVGDRVAVNPGKPCRTCAQCLSGRENLCANMIFFGSASRFPHVQGAFRETLVVRDFQCFPVPAETPHTNLVFAEPFAVALHAVAQAGSLLGRRVLITGAGPIGCLIAVAARRAGAEHVTITDLSDKPLEIATQIGAHETVNIMADSETPNRWQADRGCFDVSFEASGSAKAVETCVLSTRPGGTVVQVGMLAPGLTPIPLNRLLAKEVTFRTSFRFHEEFAWAVSALTTGGVDLSPLATAQFPFEAAAQAFVAAHDRNSNMKVQIVF
jgi:L-idonate 5-dehydrogenase